MAGRIILQDGVVTSRIIMRCKLSAACYDVCQADSPQDVRQQAKADDVVAVIMDAGDRAEEIAARVAQAGLSRSGSRPPLILLADEGNTALRLAGLAAGAEAVLVRPVDEALLLATLRRLARGAANDIELLQRVDVTESFAMADRIESYRPEKRVCIVSPSSRSPDDDQLRDLARRTTASICVQPAEHVLAQGCGADVVVLISGPAETGTSLRLIPDLKSRSPTRAAAVLLAIDTRDTADARQSIVGTGQIGAMALDLGADDVMLGIGSPEELAFRVSRLLARKVAADTLQRRISAGLRLAARDPLTGLYNRRVAMPRLDAMLSQSSVDRRPLAVMLVDLDRFKSVNDTYGHAAGDRVLTEVAARLAAAVGPRDLVARIGGEEFLLALPGTALPAASLAAGRISAALRDLPVSDPAMPVGIRVTASIGLAVHDPRRAETAAGLLDQADKALLAAKSDGRDQITVARTAA